METSPKRQILYGGRRQLDRTGVARRLSNVRGLRKDDEKKLAISEFIRDEHGIKVVDAVRELLKNQFIEAVDEDYILELKQGIQEWNGRTLLDLLTHVRSNYATMDDIVYNSITKSFAEPPDMDLPIDKYFTKQEECRLLASNSDNPITDATMVLQLTTHIDSVLDSYEEQEF